MRAYSAYEKSGSSCDASYFGSPCMPRCSQVTKFRSRLFSTSTTSVGLAQSRQWRAIVIRPFMPFICMAPSPARAITGRPGCAILAAIAYGTADPMVARPPDSDAIIPRRRDRKSVV